MNRAKGPVRCLSLGLLTFVLASGVGWAQATAQISGTVRDQTGAVLPGVEMTATQVATGITRNTLTNETGSYFFANLALGSYRLEASLPGFRTYVQTGIVLQVGSSPVINPVLEVGQVTEQVEVQANAAMVETRASGVGQVIENERILELPLDGRNVVDLIVLSGQAFQTGTTSSGRSVRSGDPALSVGGGIRAGTLYLLDGAMYTNVLDVNPLPFPFPDALQEFKVETNGLSAQHGTGASVSAVTKSGTNEFHGALFEFVRNDLFNARNYFATSSSTLKRNQFGGTLGGPILRNKLFFFGGYQYTTLRQDPADRRARIPTDAMLAGDWTAFTSPACNGGRQVTLRAPFVNNRLDPALYSRPAVEITRRLRTESGAPDPCGEVLFGRRIVRDENMAVGKVDYQWTDKHSVFGRAMLIGFEEPLPSTFGNRILNADSPGLDNFAQNYAFGSTYLISSSTVNALRVTVNMISINRSTTGAFGPTEVGINAYTYSPGYTIMSVSGGFNVSAQQFSSDAKYYTRTYTINDDVSIVRGVHQFSLGGNLMYGITDTKRGTASAPVFDFRGQDTGLGMSDFMVGRPSSLQQGNRADVYQLEWFPSLYAQDAWKATRNLTINIGLRWEPDLPWSVREGTVFNFDYDRFRQGIRSTQFAKAPPGLYYPGDPGFPGNSGVNKRWWLLSPRAGLAWDVHGDGRMSVRASYGLGYERQPMGYWSSGFVAAPFFNRITVPNPAGGLEDPWRGVPGGNPFPIQIGRDIDFRPSGDYMSKAFDDSQPSNSSWNLTVEREIARGWLASGSYIGTNTIHLWGIRAVNPAVFLGLGPCTLNTATGPVSYPVCSTTANTNERRRLSLEKPQEAQALGRLSEYDSGGTQSYHGMRLSLERRNASGATVSGNYTWSHCLQDFTSDGQLNVEQGYADPNNRHADRGNCVGSRRHMLNLTGVAETPRFANSTLRTLATGWRLAGIYRWSTGTYLTITSGVDRALTDILTQRPDQVLTNVFTDKSAGPLAQYLNPSAFALPAMGRNGSLGSGNIAGPGTWQFDVALSRLFEVRENQRLEFRAEGYNVTNSFRPGNPATNLSSGTFGRIQTALDPRILQFAVKYVF